LKGLLSSSGISQKTKFPYSFSLRNCFDSFISKTRRVMNALKVVPYYTGKDTLEEILEDKRSRDILWLEILLNDNINWEKELNNEELRKSYEKACVWYTNFKTMVEGHIKRKPLKTIKGNFDKREYRKFIEAISFVSS